MSRKRSDQPHKLKELRLDELPLRRCFVPLMIEPHRFQKVKGGRKEHCTAGKGAGG